MATGRPPSIRRTLAALVLAVAALAAAALPAAADALDDIRARGTLRVGVKADYEPFGFRDAAGELVGFDVDVARKLAETLGVQPELVAVTSADRLQKLMAGDLDLFVATLGDTRERRRLVTMVEPGYYGGGATVMLRPGSGIAGWDDLRGKPVCVLQGALWNRPFAQRFLVDARAFANLRDVKLALREGQCVGWVYDEAALQHEIASGEWPGYTVMQPAQMIGPWAIAINKQEEGGRLDQTLGDTIAELHRSGWLTALEARWKLPPSAFNARNQALWALPGDDGQPLCRRDASGEWTLACREIALVTSDEAQGLVGLSLQIREMTGLDITLLHSAFDRNLFLVGVLATLALAAASVVGCIVFGILVGWLVHRRVPVVRQVLLALTSVLRMTPPLLQLYLAFFGIGGLIATLGLTIDAFAVAVVVLSCYAGAANAIAFAEAADVAARGSTHLAFSGRDIARVMRLSYPAVMGSAVNIVKATGMASMIAVPELVHASTAIIAENGNPAVMMNILLGCYVLLIFVVVRIFSFIQARVLT